jgi:hypothetical protein
VLTSTALEPVKKEDQSIGCSKGGLSPKIHATVDTLGNPTGFTLSSGSTHDLQGAEVLLAQIATDTLIADKASVHMNGSLTDLNETAKAL